MCRAGKSNFNVYRTKSIKIKEREVGHKFWLNKECNRKKRNVRTAYTNGRKRIIMEAIHRSEDRIQTTTSEKEERKKKE